MAEKTHVKGAKAKEIGQRMRRIRLERMLDTFAEHIEDGQEIEEAAFLAGGERRDGRDMLRMIQMKIGMRQAQ